MKAGFGDTIDGYPTDIIAINGQSTEYIYTGNNWIKTIIVNGHILLNENDNIVNLDTATFGYTLHLPQNPSPFVKLVFQDQGNSGLLLNPGRPRPAN